MNGGAPVGLISKTKRAIKMKLTKSKLKQIIKEELSLLGSLDIEENFVKKHDIQIDEKHEDVDAAWDAHKKVLSIIRKISRRLNDKDSYNFHEHLKKWFCPEQETMQEEE